MDAVISRFSFESQARIMRKLKLIFIFCFIACSLIAGKIEKVYFFNTYNIETRGTFNSVTFPGTRLSGIPGEPVLPYHEVMLLLPPGESAVSMKITGEEETIIPGSFSLFPQQYARPTSDTISHALFINQIVYQQNGIYPAKPVGKLITQYLNGYAFALSSFTPLRYNPATGKLSYYRKMRVKVTTRHSGLSLEAMKNLSSAPCIRERARFFSQNPEIMQQYPIRESPATVYQYLVISPTVFKNEFQALITMYANKGITVKVVTTDSISGVMSGYDLQEKIRNYIVNQYQNNSIEYVLLAGNPALVPSRGFYCQVYSGGGYYTDTGIPADLYYSGMDGNYDANGNHIYGEVADSDDLLPDVAVARFTVNDTAGLHRLLHKTIAYLTNPVLGEMNRPLMAAEYLYYNPLTFGGPYMDLLIDNHTAHGYYTHGIPSTTNSIEKLYDTLISNNPFNVWYWSKATLIAKLNQGKSFVHHLGHADESYMLKLSLSDITNQNFALVNGVDHNYEIIYTQGCDDGAFDKSDCIAAQAVSIDNFLVAGVFNSRYGWFDEGSSPPEGPSEHLEREFVSAMYTDTLPDTHLGEAQRISKVKTAPWVTLPGEWEPGAQRWCHYDCNAFGDPALQIWTADPSNFSTVTWTGSTDNDWGKAGNWNPPQVPTSLCDVVIPATSRNPVITTLNASFCHDLLIQSGGRLQISPGKSLIVRGTATLVP